MFHAISDIAAIVLVVRHNSNDYIVERARIVLLAGAGLQDQQIAAWLKITPEKAARWRNPNKTIRAHGATRGLETCRRSVQSFADLFCKMGKCGFRPCLCQIRRTLFSLRPAD